MSLRACKVTRSAIAIAGALVLASCGGDEPLEPPNYCGEAEAECVDENTLLVCEAALWQRISCAEWCKARGPGTRSRGCLRLIGQSDECACSGAR